MRVVVQRCSRAEVRQVMEEPLYWAGFIMLD